MIDPQEITFAGILPIGHIVQWLKVEKNNVSPKNFLCKKIYFTKKQNKKF